MHATRIEQAIRYLCVFFNMDLSWKAHTSVLECKFTDLYDRISHTKPAAEMAV